MCRGLLVTLFVVLIDVQRRDSDLLSPTPPPERTPRDEAAAVPSYGWYGVRSRGTWAACGLRLASLSMAVDTPAEETYGNNTQARPIWTLCGGAVFLGRSSKCS